MPEILNNNIFFWRNLLGAFLLDCQLRIEPWESLDLVRDEGIMFTLKDDEWFRKGKPE